MVSEPRDHNIEGPGGARADGRDVDGGHCRVIL
jgi:hypothetical protein